MKLEFLNELNEYGDQLLKLYGFTTIEAGKFRDAIQKTIIDSNLALDLNTLDFIESINCKLVLHISEEDEGIITIDDKVFFCDLTIDGYRNMLTLIEPYCNKNLRSFQYLYDLDTQIDFLFSPGGNSSPCSYAEASVQA